MRTIAAVPCGIAMYTLAASHPLLAQRTRMTAGYHPHASLVSALDSLKRAYPALVSVTEIARSPGGRSVNAVRLAAGATPDQRPAILIVANAYGPHVVGSEAALGILRRLGAAYGHDSAVTQLLSRHTLYVIPRANPDAAEAFFTSGLLYERIRNEQRVDDDRDLSVDEDGPDDLNGDGMVTLMRITDPAQGEWIVDPADSLLLRRADPLKGEVGRYRVMSEGIDNDKDGAFDEDPPGGTDVNRNFTYGYQFFREAGGEYPFSTPEALAIAQFYVDHPNVAIVYVLGPQDNLSKSWAVVPPPPPPPEHAPGAPRVRPPDPTLHGAQPLDEPYFVEVGRRYRKIIGREPPPDPAELAGDVLSHAYFHMGRWAFGSRVWWFGGDSAGAGGGHPPSSGDGTSGEDLAAIRWLRANDPSGFVPWREVKHPDFPDRKVEVGGFRPYVRLDPPGTMLDSIAAQQTRFVTELGGMMPSLAIRHVKIEPVGDHLYRVTLQVFNDGVLPTLPQMGVVAQWSQPVRIDLTLKGQTLITGTRGVALPPIPGNGGSVSATWLVLGDPNSTLTARVHSTVVGDVSETLTLRARGVTP